MRVLQFLFFLGLTLTSILLLNKPTMDYPPLGRLLDPVSGFWANIATDDREEVLLADVGAQVKVYWDAHEIPHIVAENERDLYYTQGYVAAHHRLWAMELLYLRHAGKLSSLLGAHYLEEDRLQRRLGLGMAAERAWEVIQQDIQVRAMVESYTGGINAYIRGLSYKDYPVAYKLLDYAPAEWTPYKTCLILKGLEADMSIGGYDLAHSALIQRLGRVDFDGLYPAFSDRPDAVLPEEEEAFSWAEEVPVPPQDLDTPRWHLPQTKPLSNRLWVDQVAIGRTQTADSSVMLAHSVHAPLQLPAQWYLVQLESPRLHLVGGSIPGIPGVLIGANQHIAWGFSPTGRDIADWYQVALHSAEGDEYRYNNDRYKTQTRIEAFDVRGAAVFYDTVRYTHHGPLVYDRHFSGQASHSTATEMGLALRWAGHLASNPLRWVYAMAHAHSYRDVEKSLDASIGPHAYLLMGSAHGPMALWPQGRYPHKWTGQGRLVLDGTHPAHDWQGYIADKHRWSLFNPARGFISTARQSPVAQANRYGYAYYGDHYEDYRGRRINERLRAMEGIQAADLMKLHTDHFNYLAYEALPLMLDSLQSASLALQESQIVQSLREWDYFNRSEDTAPTYFAEWFQQLYQRIWDELDASATHLPTPAHTVHLMKNEPLLAYYDEVSSLRRENLHTLINESFDAMVQVLNNWQAAHPDKALQWGHVHPVHIQHPFAWASFGIADVPINGSAYSLNATHGGFGNTLRLIVHLTPEGQTQCWAVYPGGQPENPGHPLAKSLAAIWQEGKYLALPLITHRNKDPKHVQYIQPAYP